MRNFELIYQSWVSHVANEAEKKAIIAALLNCNSASSLASLISDNTTSHDNAIEAFRRYAGITNKTLTISDFVAEETEFQQRYDI